MIGLLAQPVAAGSGGYKPPSAQNQAKEAQVATHLQRNNEGLTNFTRTLSDPAAPAAAKQEAQQQIAAIHKQNEDAVQSHPDSSIIPNAVADQAFSVNDLDGASKYSQLAAQNARKHYAASGSAEDAAVNKSELLQALNVHAAVADKKQDWAAAKRDTDEIINLKPEDPKILEAAQAINAMARSHIGRAAPGLKKDTLGQPWSGVAGGGDQLPGAAKGAPGAAGAPAGLGAGPNAITASAREPAEIRKLLQDSQTRLGLGDPEGALKAALDVAEKDEKNAQARLLAAIALMALDHMDQALKAANQAIQLNEAQGGAADPQQKPWLAAAYTTRGRAEEALAQPDQARSDYQKAVELDPQGQAQAATAFLQRLDQNLGGARRTAAAVPGAADAARRKRTGWLLIVLGALTFGAAIAAALKLKRGSGATTTRSRAALVDDTPATAGGLCPGLRLGHYEIRRPLGRGGMGEVWEAFDHSLNRLVAIKKVAGSAPGDQDALDGLIEEALNVAKLKHPNIVSIHFVFRGQQTGDIYVVFEHLAEGTVMDALQAGPIPPAQVAAIVRGVCSALDFAHGQGVIHRDLKPSNILLERGEAKVGDFGIAKLTDHSDGTMTIRNVGTPAYMAPEQAAGAVSRQTDLYALGVSAYQMLTGRLPFPQARPDLKTRGEFTPATQLVPTLPPAVDAFFNQALDPDPKLRFKKGSEFATAFVQAVGTETPLPRSA